MFRSHMLMKNRFPDGKGLMSIGVFGAMLLSVLGLSAALGAPQAYAEDQKVYPGNACAAYSPEDNADLFRHFGGGIWNESSSSDAFITCPIVRDNVLNGNGTKRAIVRVHNTRTDALAVSCTLVSMSGQGQFITSRSATATTTGFVNLEVGVNASANLGLYYIYCYLPQKQGSQPAGVLNYWINEHDGV